MRASFATSFAKAAEVEKASEAKPHESRPSASWQASDVRQIQKVPMNKILILSIAALIGTHAYADEKTFTVATPLQLNRDPAKGMQVCAANAEQLRQRLRVLRAELKAEEAALSDLEQKEAQLRQTLIRTKEAIRLIEEELAKAGT